MQVGSNRCILNPVSGGGGHAEYVRPLMEARGFAVQETESGDDAVRLGFEAGTDGVSKLAVCGGDGTVNGVLRGLAAADHLEDVTLAVVPTGTANLLAGTLGIRDVDHGIELADAGETRSVDVGMADEQPFVVSCIAGLPAEASTSASGGLKERLGTLAFVVTGVQEAREFEGLDIRVEATGGADAGETWEGEAVCLLVGNARKFVEDGGQADMEDGLFDVAIVEQMPAGNLVAEAIGHRLLGRGTEGVTHLRASDVAVESAAGPITFSRDGELATHDALHLSVTPRALDVRVGREYEPSPE
jgi:YegS/Rv2252/BmrU family lipid kinase